jgi:signal transduction histidine kinase
MTTLRQILRCDTYSRRHVLGRVGYFVSVALAGVFLLVGLCVYRYTQVHPERLMHGGWQDVLPTVAMAYGTLLLLAVAIIEIRVRHVRADSLVLRARTLDDLVAHLTECQEAERESLSVKLHDDLGGTLTALKLEIEAIERKDGNNAEDWRRVNRLTEDLFERVRGLSALLYPRMIGKVGLNGALEELASRFRSDRLDIVLSVSSAPSAPSAPTPDQGLCVLRVVQEAIVNASRHAEARRVWVSLEYENGRLIGAVDDDGMGWHGDGAGMGLTLMRERVRKLGGRLTLEDSARGGARVRFSIPVGKETA